MTDAERDELIANVWAQATGTQSVLNGILHALKRRGDTQMLEEIFHIASEPVVIMSYNANPQIKNQATRVLQVVDHIRQSVMGKDVPKPDTK